MDAFPYPRFQRGWPREMQWVAPHSDGYPPPPPRRRGGSQSEEQGGFIRSQWNTPREAPLSCHCTTDIWFNTGEWAEVQIQNTATSQNMEVTPEVLAIFKPRAVAVMSGVGSGAIEIWEICTLE